MPLAQAKATHAAGGDAPGSSTKRVRSENLLTYILKRIAASVPVLLVLSIVTFVLIQAPPGDYADTIKNLLITESGATVEAAELAAEAYRVQNGLNDPIYVQYARWMWGIVTRGDLGLSLDQNRPVAEIVSERLPRTLLLALICHILGTVIGVLLGIVAASRQNTWIDAGLGIVAFMGVTVPRFLIALILIYLLAFHWDVREIGSFFSPRYSAAPWSIEKFLDLVQHVWPVVAIATFSGLAYNMRVMRGNLLDVMNQQYIETARAKGLPESAVLLKHAAPNALHPLVAHQGVALPYMLTGEIEVAIVFGLATVGPAIIESMAVGDVNVTATIMLVLAATLIIGNLVADVLLTMLDPRVRLKGGQA